MSFTTIDRTAYNLLVDDDGSGNTGTVWSKSNVQDTLNAIDSLFSSNNGISCNGAFTESGRATAMGYWTPVTFSAGNFTAGGTGTWTVASGNQTTFQYMLVGKMMTVAFFIVNTSLSSTPSFLTIAVPGSYVANRRIRSACMLYDDGTSRAGYVEVVATGTQMNVGRADGGSFSASSGGTEVYGELTFEIQ